MGKRLWAATAVLIFVGAVSCASDDEESYSCDLCVDAPEAIAADDQRSAGVYKGALTADDCSGVIKVTVASDESTGALQVAVDGKVFTASSFTITADGSNVVVTQRSGQSEIEVEKKKKEFIKYVHIAMQRNFIYL